MRRAQILRLIDSEPGISGAEVSRSLGTPRTTTIFHLEWLVATGQLQRIKAGRHASYFVTGKYSAQKMAALATLNSESKRRVLQAVATQPAVALTDLAENLDMAASALSAHLASLEAAGLIASTRAPRSRRVSCTRIGEAAASWVTESGAAQGDGSGSASEAPSPADAPATGASPT